MIKKRTIKELFVGEKIIEGAGVCLDRIFGYYDVPEVDPFLLLEFLNTSEPKDYLKGFPWHPHRGIETVTYLIEGEIEHEDNVGNKDIIKSGDCQWMTAGNGIIHQELPKEVSHMLGIQLWINLKANDKMTEPKYSSIKSSQIPEIKEGNVRVKVIAGKYKDIVGPVVGTSIDLVFLDITIENNEKFIYKTDPDSTIFAFVVQGEGIFDIEKSIVQSVGEGVLYDFGDQIEVKASKKGVRFFIFSGKPIKELVAWGGPIVMNTKKELEIAFEELENGTFIKQ